MATLPNNTAPAVVPSQKTVITEAAVKAINAIRKVDGLRTEAVDTLRGAQNNAAGKRAALLMALAAASIVKNWVNSEIDDGIAAAVALATDGSNKKKDTTLTTWAAQMRLACYPAVRNHVKPVYAITSELWAAETAAINEDKDAPRPLRTGFKRQDHMALALLAEAKDGRTYPDAETILALAEKRNPLHDAAAIAARLKSIVTKLSEFVGEFPHEDIAACVDLLRGIKADDLRAARSTPAAPATAPATAPTAAPAPVAGVSDVLDDLDGTLAAID